MAVVPTLKVEISFVSTPLATAPTWVDVSAYVRQAPGVSIKRGRQSELDNFDAGSCHITLSNRDRRFDPSYSAGPYFGNLIPRKQIRVTATWSAVDYIMFQGWVTGWPQGFAAPAGLDATVTIEAVDAMAWLASTRMPSDLVYSYANTTIGSLAFFLRGADTTTWNDATSNGYYTQVMTGGGRTSPGLGKGSTSQSIALDGSTIWRTHTDYTASGNWSLAFWMQTSTLANQTLIGGNYITSTTFAIGTTTLGKLAVIMDGSTVGHASVIVADGLPHHVVLTGDTANGAQSLYVDGTFRSSVAPGTTDGLKFSVVGTTDVRSDYTGVTLFQGSVGDIAVFTKQLSASEVAQFYYRSNGFLSENSATRVGRILDDVGWPATWRSITATPEATVGELVYNAKTANELLQEVQRTEQGRIFAAKTNFITFLSRYYTTEITAGNTVQQIFSDDGGATALPYSTFGFQYNDIDVTNDVTVTTPDTYASSSDSTSITANGRQSRKIDTILSTFDDANSMAAGLVAQGKNAAYRVDPIVVYPANNTSRWANVLGLELGDRVGIEQTPMKVGSQNAQEVTVEQIEWLIEDGQWSYMVAGSPCLNPTTVTDGWFVVAVSLVGSTTDLIGY